MWFLGLLLGAGLGSLAGGEFAVAGAIVGLVGGLLWSASHSARKNDRLAQLEDEIALLRGRLDAVERMVARQEAAPPVTVSAASAAAQPPIAPEAPVATLAGETATLRAAVAALPGSGKPAAEPPPDVAPGLPEPDAAPVPATQYAPLERPAAPPAGPHPLVAWFLGGNTVVRAGVVILFFGVAFLLKYASEHVQVPIELRLAGVALGALALLVAGWRLRTKRAGYALALQGGGIGLLYLTIFAAFRLYALLPALPTFALLAGVAAFSAMLAVLQDARSLAIAGVTGGFLAPVLVSTGTGSHVMLFGYYAVLNLGILAIALHKAWRELNLVGFAFTFVIGGLWGAKYYRPGFYASTEPFLLFFFLLYVMVAVLFALREAPRLRHYVDGTLVFGTPLVAFWYQTRLVEGIEFGAAWSAAALGFFYLLLARGLVARGRDSLRMLVESFLGLGVAFATLAIPLAADGRWTCAAWALEGAAILWVGIRQRRLLPQVCGMLLQVAAGIAFLKDLSAPSADTPLLNSLFVGALLVALGGLACSWLAARADDDADWRPTTTGALLVWGLAWWCGTGLHEIDRFVPAVWRDAAMLVFLVATGCAFSVLHRRLAWEQARHVPALVLPLIVTACAVQWLDHVHPFAGGGWVAWPAALAGHYWILRRHEADFGSAAVVYHAAGLWVLAILGARELGWLIADGVEGAPVWRAISWAVVPALLLAGLARRGEGMAWPVAAQARAYRLVGAAPLAAFTWLWTIATSASVAGDPAPLPYVPLANPLELAQFGALLAVAAWLLRIQTMSGVPAPLCNRPLLFQVAGATAFVWSNGVLLRCLHHYAAVPFRPDAMLRSTLVQASLSIFWTLIALGAMVVATRRQWRPLWIAGGALMAVVVAKLFFVDLSSLGGIERIVSFIGVGLLMLLVGYFSPVPPRAERPAP